MRKPSLLQSNEQQQANVYHQDVFRLIQQLNRNPNLKDQPNEASNKYSNVWKSMFSEQSQRQSVSQKFSMIPLQKPTLVKKKSIKPIKEAKHSYQSEHSNNQLSNISAQYIIDQKSFPISHSLKIQNDKNHSHLEEENKNDKQIKENSILRQAVSKIQTKKNTLNRIQMQIQDSQRKTCENNEKFLLQKKKYQNIYRKILQLSIKNRLQYCQYKAFLNKEKQKMFEIDLKQRLEYQIKYLQGEQNRLKSKRGKKAQSMSDEEENKHTQSLDREKKPYISYILSKIQKQAAKSKEATAESEVFQLQYTPLKQQKLNHLKTIQKLQDYEVLCYTQTVNEKIPQILAFNLQRLGQSIITCYEFHPMMVKQKRIKTYQQLVNVYSKCRKIVSGSANIHFPQKSSLFIPLTTIIYSNLEIYFVNEKNQNYLPLEKFLNRLNFGNIDQSLSTIKYLIKVCLKAARQINAIQINSLILPTNIFVNDKFQLRFRNIFFNQVLYNEFKNLVDFQELSYYYPPEEKTDPTSSIYWSIGILTYILCFNMKPFVKYQPYSWSSRQEFFVINSLQTPQKANLHEKTLEFIYICLTKKGVSSLLDLSSDWFLANSK